MTETLNVMTESFLHYVWQFQYFDKKDLATIRGEPVQVFSPGVLNHHAGPDFLNARIRIGEMEWIGNVEIHIHASEWRHHHHDQDHAYDNVVLHVVWKCDWDVTRRDGSLLPAIELRRRVDKSLILKYTKLISSSDTIPCASRYPLVDRLIRHSMMDRTLVQRLEKKAGTVLGIWRQANNDWEETFYQVLCANFGFKVNTEPLQQLARALPFRIVLKHCNSLLHIEALLFGQGGFLDSNFRESYFLLLKREYELLETKYRLKEKKLNAAQWRFLRLRPANFPTLRLAQLASVFHHHPRIFSLLLETNDVKALRSIFAVTQSAFWLQHYRFGLRQKTMISPMGTMSIDNIIVNSVVPVLVAYGRAADEQQWVDKSIALLKQMPAEQNAVTRKWNALGESIDTAFDSQALIELYREFCLKRRCLSCSIGSSLVNPEK
jgi:hypothetical protein